MKQNTSPVSSFRILESGRLVLIISYLSFMTQHIGKRKIRGPTSLGATRACGVNIKELLYGLKKKIKTPNLLRFDEKTVVQTNSGTMLVLRLYLGESTCFFWV